MSPDDLDPELRANPALLGRVRAVAAKVLRDHGDDLGTARPTDGWVNPGWVSDRYVVRVSLVPDRSRLHREAAIGGSVPSAVGYPEIVDVGVVEGHEYLVTRRIEGTNLSQAWDILTRPQRANALEQLWEVAEVVHRTPLHHFPDVDLSSTPFYADSLTTAMPAMEVVHRAGLLTASEVESLLSQLERFFDARQAAPLALNHGDLYIGNALWDGMRIVSLLDFEFAVAAPIELDFNELAKHVFGPTSDRNGPLLNVEQRAVSDLSR